MLGAGRVSLPPMDVQEQRDFQLGNGLHPPRQSVEDAGTIEVGVTHGPQGARGRAEEFVVDAARVAGVETGHLGTGPHEIGFGRGARRTVERTDPSGGRPVGDPHARQVVQRRQDARIAVADGRVQGGCRVRQPLAHHVLVLAAGLQETRQAPVLRQGQEPRLREQQPQRRTQRPSRGGEACRSPGSPSTRRSPRGAPRPAGWSARQRERPPGRACPEADAPDGRGATLPDHPSPPSHDPDRSPDRSPTPAAARGDSHREGPAPSPRSRGLASFRPFSPFGGRIMTSVSACLRDERPVSGGSGVGRAVLRREGPPQGGVRGFWRHRARNADPRERRGRVRLVSA